MSSSVDKAADTAKNATGTDGAGSPTAVQRVLSIPVVADAIGAIDSTIRSNSYAAAGLDRAEGVAEYAYAQAKPITDRFAGPIGQVDKAANAALDAVQARLPYVFEVKTDDIVGRARQPADAAISRGRDVVDGVHSYLSASQARLTQLQDGLTKAIRDPKTVQDHVRSLLDQVSTELDKVSQTLADRRKELPQQAHDALGPLFDRFSTVYDSIKQEIGRADAPLQARANNVLKVSREQATPLVNDIIERIRTLLRKADKKGTEAVDEAKSTANGIESDTKTQATNAKKQASAAVNSASSKADEAVGQAKSEANKTAGKQ